MLSYKMAENGCADGWKDGGESLKLFNRIKITNLMFIYKICI